MAGDIQWLFGMTGLLVLRVGVPILTLAVLGALVSSWQNRREKQMISRQFSPGND